MKISVGGQHLSFRPFLTAQRAKPQAYHQLCVLFSRFRLISHSRKVKMTHFKSPKSSTGCGQCREALGKGPTASGGSGMLQEGSLIALVRLLHWFFGVPVWWTGAFDNVTKCHCTKFQIILLKIYFSLFPNKLKCQFYPPTRLTLDQKPHQSTKNGR